MFETGQKINDTTDLILMATNKYNRTIDSVIDKKIIDIVHAIPREMRNEITIKIMKA